MAEKIFSIKLNAEDYIKASAQIKASIDALKQSQKELDTTTEQGRQQYVSTAATIKSLNEQYNFTQKQIINLSESTSSLADKTTAVNAVMQMETKTINGLNAQNTALNKIKKNLNIENSDEAELIKKINVQLDSNTDKVKENSSEVEKQKMNIGNYKSGVTDLLGQLKSGEIGIGGFTKGIWGMTKAFLASPIGWIALALVGLISLFKTFQPIVDKVEQVFSALNAVMNVIAGTIMKVFNGTKSLGSAFKSLGSDMKNAAAAAYELKKAQQDLEDQMEAQEIASSKARAEADKLTAQSKDLSKTEAERVKLLQKSEEIMRKDFESRKKIADKDKENSIEALRIKTGLSKEEIKLAEEDWFKFRDLAERKGVRLKEDLDKYKETIIKRSDIDQEANQFLEKNIAKQNSLIEKQQAKEEKAREEAIQKNQAYKDSQIKIYEDEISLYEAQESAKQKSVLETFEYEKTLMDKRNELNAKNYEFGKISKQEYETEKINILNQYEVATLEATANNLNKELELWKLQNEALLSSKGELNQQLVDAEKIAQNTLYDKRAEIVNKTISNEQEKSIALAQIEIERQNALDGITAEWETKKKENEQLRRESEAVDYELKLENMRLNNESEFLILEEKYAREKELLDLQLADKKLSEEQYQLALVNLTKATEEEKTKIKEIQESNRLELASQTFGALANIFGKESAAGKAMAIAQTTIDTYQAAQKAYKSMVEVPVIGPTLAVIAAASAVATGLANVKKIVGVKNEAKFAHGYIAGNGYNSYDSYSNDVIPALISKGEAVIPASVVNQNRELIGGLIGSRQFANGYMSSPSQSSISNTIDITNQLKQIQVINVPEEAAAVMNNVIKTKQYANV